jgi:hypothetical protein
MSDCLVKSLLVEGVEELADGGVELVEGPEGLVDVVEKHSGAKKS